MRDYLIAAVFFGAVPFILARPKVGIVMWCVVSYMNPHRLTWGWAYSYPFAAITAAATLTSVLFSKEPKRIPWTATSVVWVIFIVWMSFTTLFALVPGDAHDEWSRTMKIQIMTFVTLMVMTSRDRLHMLVWAIVISLGFYGVKGGLFAILTGGEYRVSGPPESFIEDNNSLALALVMILPLMRYLQLNSAQRWVRLGLTAAMVLSVLSALASYSRGAFLAITAMAFMLFMKSRRKGIILAAMLVLIPAVLSFMPEKWYERIETIEHYDQDKSTLGRFNAWWFAYNLAMDRPVGGGFNTFDPKLFQHYAPEPNNFHDSHSIYFEVLGEHGFVGLFLFLLLLWLTFRNGSWVNRHAAGREDLRWALDLSAMVQVSLVGYAVGGAFLGMAYYDLYWHLVAINLLTRTLVEQALKEAKSAAALSPTAVETASPAATGLAREIS